MEMRRAVRLVGKSFPDTHHSPLSAAQISTLAVNAARHRFCPNDANYKEDFLPQPVSSFPEINQESFHVFN